MNPETLYRLLSVLILAALLLLPVSRIVWVLSVRRLQRRLGRELTTTEQQGQLRRARFIAVFMTLVFSYLFHVQVIFPLHD
ncbi:MAG: hypothetical protein R3202_11275 [Candidatus Competibacterales bacterium]|nr:hypothetical protein [Candidatus Competibacterales bacterium]